MRNSPKHEPTDSYFYIAIHIDKCMIIADDFNLHSGSQNVRKHREVKNG